MKKDNKTLRERRAGLYANKATLTVYLVLRVVVVLTLVRAFLRGEFESVLRAVGGADNLIDWEKKSPEIDLLRYTDDKIAKENKIFDRPELMKTPIVRNGKRATVGYCPEVWKQWEAEK